MNRTFHCALSALFVFWIALLFPVCSLAVQFDITFPSRGAEIPATVNLPEARGGALPVVVFAHGHNGSRDENRGFIAIADALADAGFASVRMDFAGCGASSESFLSNCLTTMKADLAAAVAYAQTQLNASCIGLFGYSMGGRVILEALAEGLDADAVALLAPAADTQDLIRTTFEDFEAMHEKAKTDGYCPNHFGDGQVEELSLAWFDDLLRYDDPALSAAQAYSGPALVLYAQDDAIISPAVCEHVAAMLEAETADASGKGHGYGFFLETDLIREGIAQNIVHFFSIHLR